MADEDARQRRRRRGWRPVRPPSVWASKDHVWRKPLTRPRPCRSGRGSAPASSALQLLACHWASDLVRQAPELAEVGRRWNRSDPHLALIEPERLGQRLALLRHPCVESWTVSCPSRCQTARIAPGSIGCGAAGRPGDRRPRSWHLALPSKPPRRFRRCRACGLANSALSGSHDPIGEEIRLDRSPSWETVNIAVPLHQAPAWVSFA